MKGRQSVPVLSLLLVFVLWEGWLPCFAVAAHHSLGCRSLRFAIPVDGVALQGYVIENVSFNMEADEVRFECRVLCGLESTCVSINIGSTANDSVRLCQLSNSDHTRHPEDLQKQEGFAYWATENPCTSDPCLHNATCLNGFTDKRYICLCQAGYTGEHCETDFNAMFTNLGSSGRSGPTSLGSHYTGQDHDGQVTLSNGIQLWTVPYDGEYKIQAVGAAGGYLKHKEYRGRGARIIGTFSLFKGETIQILVGQEGWGKTGWKGSAGGGGTFVVRGSNTPLIIAGGGGGIQKAQLRHAGCDANTSTTGSPGYKSWSGGSDGHGAQVADDPSGGGGGGFFSNGRDGHKPGTVARGGRGFFMGGKGGSINLKHLIGGFGGGGAGLPYGKGAGGGGGYSGGSSGNNETDSCGGGGGSYNTGTNQENDCCYNAAGHGMVTITLL